MKRPQAQMQATAGQSADSTFEEFFRVEHGRLLGALFLMTTNRSEAEDLMQEAFLKVWERWDRIQVMESPTGYLYRTAMNLFRSRMRRATSMLRRSVGWSDSVLEEGAVETHDTVIRALRAIPPRQRAALVLTELMDVDTSEAAHVMGVKAATVRSLASQ